MAVQLLAGVALEMTHGSTRIFAIYMTGVLAGNRLITAFDKCIYRMKSS